MLTATEINTTLIPARDIEAPHEAITDMKMHRFAACLMATMLALGCIPIVQAELPQPVTKLLRANNIPEEAVSAIVLRIADGHPLVAEHAERSMQPASTMKLLTTIVGLETMGPARRWKTEFRSRAPLVDGVLDGDLVLRGGGDGDLDWPAFYRLLQSLRQQGIAGIRGNLVLDRNLFQPARGDIGVPPFDESPEFQYNVIPDALLVNTNLLQFDFNADAQSLAVRITPELPGVSADLQLRLVDRPCKQWEDGWQVPLTTRSADGSIRIGLRGEFPRNCAVTTRLNVLDRNDYIERLFRGLWTYLGGSFSGQVVEGRAPDDARLLAEHSSRPLAELLRDINKTSDNPLARLLFLSLGTGGAVAGSNTPVNSAKAVRGWLQQQGIGDAGLVLDNGSGLSRSERIRPAMLAALLAAEYRSNWAPEFVSSLPIVALDGSMRRRLADSPAAGRARLKTGSLRNVAAIAGYVPDGSGQMQVVVAMINFDFPKDVSGQPILDALVDWVAHSGGK